MFYALKDSLHDLHSSRHVLACDLGTEVQITAPWPKLPFCFSCEIFQKIDLIIIDVLYSGFFLSFFCSEQKFLV